jgi:hypothetical protein
VGGALILGATALKAWPTQRRSGQPAPPVDWRCAHTELWIARARRLPARRALGCAARRLEAKQAGNGLVLLALVCAAAYFTPGRFHGRGGVHSGSTHYVLDRST